MIAGASGASDAALKTGAKIAEPTTANRFTAHSDHTPQTDTKLQGMVPWIQRELEPMRRAFLINTAATTAALAAAACTPTLRVEAPAEPITINLNINLKIDGDVRVRMERDLDQAVQANPGLF